MKLYSVGVACAIIVVACGGETNPNADVVTDRPNSIGLDVPNPPGIDVPNPPTDSPSCPPGQLICGASMVCADTQVDNNNCGMCGNACAAGRQCVAGVCACNMGTTQCGMACSDVMTDSANCGACGTACAAGQMCVAGMCRIGCQLPNTVCRDAMGVMTCSNPATDLNNCGACATVCAAANGTPSCVGGMCGVASCAAGFGNCDNMAGNGCETNTNSLISDCGRCGNVCPAPANGVAACTMGACGLAGCQAGFGNCDANEANGCEVNLASAVANCGACGMACPARANAAAACTMGACGIGACNAGFANCDGQAANGCEINTLTNVANCGACGTVCGAGQACTNGVCGCPAPTFACVAGGVTSCVESRE